MPQSLRGRIVDPPLLSAPGRQALRENVGERKGEATTIPRHQKRIIRHLPTQEKLEGRCDDHKGQIMTALMNIKFTNTTDEVVLYIGEVAWRHQKRNRQLGETRDSSSRRSSFGSFECTSRAWGKRIKNLVKRENQPEENIQALYFLLWHQCSEALRRGAVAVPGHEVVVEPEEGMGLLKEISDVWFSFLSQQFLPGALHCVGKLA